MPDLIAELHRRWNASLEALQAAILFLTRLPLPFTVSGDVELQRQAMGWYPLVGAGLGLGAGLVFALMRAFGVPPLGAALLALALLVVVTGALHEDGLADSADGLGGGRDPDQKLAIMRDSRIGTYGTLALILSIGLRAAFLASLGSTFFTVRGLMVAEALSRAAAVYVAVQLPPARSDGLSAGIGNPGRGVLALALGLSAVLALLLVGWRCLPVILLAGAATWGLTRFSQRQIGGQTGDILGAVQQLVELTVLVTLATLP